MATQAVIRHFERVALDYPHLRERWPLGRWRRHEEHAVAALAQIAPGERVLDVGCGDGVTLTWLARVGARAVGVDVTRPMAAHCRRRGFDVCVQDMERLGFRACFDWVLCIGAMEFTAQPVLAVQSFATCLRPSGRLALLFPRRNLLGGLYAAYHRTHGIRARRFSREEITGLLRVVGLEVEAWRDCALSSVCRARQTGADGARPT